MAVYNISVPFFEYLKSSSTLISASALASSVARFLRNDVYTLLSTSARRAGFISSNFFECSRGFVPPLVAAKIVLVLCSALAVLYAGYKSYKYVGSLLNRIAALEEKVKKLEQQVRSNDVNAEADFTNLSDAIEELQKQINDLDSEVGEVNGELAENARKMQAANIQTKTSNRLLQADVAGAKLEAGKAIESVQRLLDIIKQQPDLYVDKISYQEDIKFTAERIDELHEIFEKCTGAIEQFKKSIEGTPYARPLTPSIDKITSNLSALKERNSKGTPRPAGKKLDFEQPSPYKSSFSWAGNAKENIENAGGQTPVTSVQDYNISPGKG